MDLVGNFIINFGKHNLLHDLIDLVANVLEAVDVETLFKVLIEDDLIRRAGDDADWARKHLLDCLLPVTGLLLSDVAAVEYEPLAPVLVVEVDHANDKY